MRTARLVLTPWLCRNSMISRTCLASFHACAIRSRRFGPIPSTDWSSAARFSITARTSAEPPDQLLCKDRPYALDQAAAEVPLNTLGGGRRHGLHARCFELQPVFLVPDPPALRAQPFPRRHGRQRTPRPSSPLVARVPSPEGRRSRFLRCGR